MNVTIDTHVLKHAVKNGLGLILWGGLLSSSLAFSNPDFSEVDDVLEGDRQLLRNDDLVYFGIACPNSMCQTEWRLFSTSNSKISGEPFAPPNDGPTHPWTVSSSDKNRSVALVAGRMFSLPHDIFIGIAPVSSTAGGLSDTFVFDPVNRVGQGFQYTGSIAGEVDFAEMADVNYDGFDDLIVHTSLGAIYLGAANDVKKFNSGIFMPTVGSMELSNNGLGPRAFTVFEARVGGGRKYKTLAMVEPAEGKKGMLRITYQRFQGSQDDFEKAGPLVHDWLTLPEIEGDLSFISLAVGRYSRPDRDQLALAYVTQSGIVRVAAYDIDIDSFHAFTLKSSLKLATNGAGFGAIIKSGRLNGLGRFDQAVVWTGPLGTAWDNTFRVLTFDSSLNIASPSEFGMPRSCVSDFALGRFDRRTAGQTQEPDLSLQVAMLLSSGRCTDFAAPAPYVAILNIDPANKYKMTLAGEGYQSISPTSNYASSKLVAGDFQGRSLRLGEPVKFTTAQSEVQIALQSPPSHTDWVTPAEGGDPIVLNLSAAPSDYFTKFRAESGKTVSASHKGSFGWTTSTYFKGNLFVGAGTDKDNNIGGTVKWSVQNKENYQNDTRKDEFDKQTFDVTTQTGFGDLVWYMDLRRNVYIYPVLGVRDCPADKPACGEDEKGPAFVHVVADDQVSRRVQAGSNLEWFQPVAEPGNVFSYPYNYSQLASLYPDIQPLTSTAPLAFATDDTLVEQNFRWEGGSTEEKTITTGNGFTGDLSAGIKGKTYGLSPVKIEGEMEVGGNKDEASKSADTNTTTLSQSSGIGIKKAGGFADPNMYRYEVQPYVFGRKRDASWPDFGELNGDIQSHGPLQVAYAVDVSQGGAWWQSGAYTVPDVALNHPARWRIADKSAAPQACLGKSCAVFNEANLSNVWLSPFHWMRGFYVTPAETSGASTQPQMAQLTQGEAVRLNARVYNYSLANMPTGSQVKVRFYGQPWDVKTNKPVGQSFLIEERAYDRIPGFGHSPSEFNWIMAEAQFDPSPYVNQDLVFWMLAWMEDVAGEKVAEVAGHGLTGTAAPGALNNIQEVPIEKYSNNVGMYKHAFHVFASGGLRAEPPTGAKKKLRDKTRVLKFRVTPRLNVVEGETVAVELVLKNLDVPVSQMTAVQFYDYNPGKRGPEETDSPFDIDQISHLPANERISVAVPYTPSRCGKTVLYATVPDRNIRAKTSFNVLCR